MTPCAASRAYKLIPGMYTRERTLASAGKRRIRIYGRAAGSRRAMAGGAPPRLRALPPPSPCRATRGVPGGAAAAFIVVGARAHPRADDDDVCGRAQRLLRGRRHEDGLLRGRRRVVEDCAPHVYVAAARRGSEGRTVASSVCVGHGRTLKGRDLRAVRNAVLHMTGFLGGGPDEY